MSLRYIRAQSSFPQNSSKESEFRGFHQLGTFILRGSEACLQSAVAFYILKAQLLVQVQVQHCVFNVLPYLRVSTSGGYTEDHDLQEQETDDSESPTAAQFKSLWLVSI